MSGKWLKRMIHWQGLSDLFNVDYRYGGSQCKYRMHIFIDMMYAFVLAMTSHIDICFIMQTTILCFTSLSVDNKCIYPFSPLHINLYRQVKWHEKLLNRTRQAAAIVAIKQTVADAHTAASPVKINTSTPKVPVISSSSTTTSDSVQSNTQHILKDSQFCAFTEITRSLAKNAGQSVGRCGHQVVVIRWRFKHVCVHCRIDENTTVLICNLTY
jgi:hypothetical protein